MTPTRAYATRLWLALLFTATGGSFTSLASAHDTWFEPLQPRKPGEVMLALGTGNRFPVHEFTVGAASLQQSGCRNPGGTSHKPVPLKTVRETTQALIVRAALKPQRAATCWAQQTPFEVAIPPETVERYLREIAAPAAVRAAWAEMRSRGVAWKERYTKHARIELPGARREPTAASPADMAMDVLLDSGSQPVRPGSMLGFQVLRDGQPLPDLPVELRSDLSPIGFWKKTDAQGRVSFQPPLAGRWVLRGTDLRLSSTVPDTWDSRFVTLAFEVR